MNYSKLRVLNPLRMLGVFFAVAFIFLTTSLPSYAALGFGNSSASSPDHGPDQLIEIEKRSQDVSNRSNPLSLKDVQARTEAAQGGLNEVQGAADKENMSRPENSGNATSVIEKVEKGLDKIVNND
ncbi:MAG TPA: hypothetical protein V6D19_23970 [Stenomitos sp.]